MTLRRKAALAVLAAAGSAAVAAGVARSTGGETIPDAQGVIHACHKKPIGEVKIVYSAANCGPGQVPIEWSKAGGQGPQGPQGEPGPQGPPGPPGAGGGGVHVFENTLPNTNIGEVGGQGRAGTFLVLAEPGTYWITAKGSLRAGSNVTTDKVGLAECTLETGGSQLDSTSVLVVHSDAVTNTIAPDVIPFTVSDVTQITQADQFVHAVCTQFGGQPDRLNVSLENLRIVALKVS
jgi:hypothetical protein